MLDIIGLALLWVGFFGGLNVWLFYEINKKCNIIHELGRGERAGMLILGPVMTVLMLMIVMLDYTRKGG